MNNRAKVVIVVMVLIGAFAVFTNNNNIGRSEHANSVSTQKQQTSQPKESLKTDTNSTKKVAEKSSSTNKRLQMPKFEAVDHKMGSALLIVAAYYEDRSKENIILAAKCWKNQKGSQNVIVYFVNDPTYKIDRKREETSKVIAVYAGTSMNNSLTFTNPDGTEDERISM